MFGRARMLVTIAAFALAMPAAAQAPTPTTTAFDGKYLGTAKESRLLHNVACPTIASVAMIIIGGQVVIHESNFNGGTATFRGSVNSGGEVLALSPPGSTMSGTINDKIFAGLSRHGHWCAWNVQMAPAPAPTMPFDGDYIGVSRESSGIGCPPNAVPATLIIRNGVVLGLWQGTVGPQGAIVMRNPKFTRVDAQIDPQGTIRGQLNDASGCAVTFLWRKQSG
jgi:hypothetical protein